MEFMRQQQFSEKVSHLAFYGSKSKFMKSLTEKLPIYEENISEDRINESVFKDLNGV
jgi:hypothetical protein